MKKSYLLFLFFLCFFGSFSFAQRIEDISVNLCPQQETGLVVKGNSFVVQGGENHEICLDFANGSTSSMTIDYSLTDAILVDGVHSCQTTSSIAEFFPSSGDNKIILGSGSQKKLYQKLQIPVGVSGTVSYGCFGYNVSIPSSGGGNLYTVVIRKNLPLDLLVGNAGASIKNAISFAPVGSSSLRLSDKVEIIQNSEGLFLHMVLMNSGNTTQTVVLSGALTNILGYKKDFVFTGNFVSPGSSVSWDVPLKDIPSYKGIFSLSIQGLATPVFPFDTSTLDAKLLAPVSLGFSTQIFVFSRTFILIVLIVLLLLIKMFWPKKKQIIYAAPSSPVSTVIEPTVPVSPIAQ